VWSASVPPITLSAAKRPARTTEAVPCNNHQPRSGSFIGTVERKGRVQNRQHPLFLNLASLDHGVAVNTQSCISYLDIVVPDEMALPVLLQQVKKK